MSFYSNNHFHTSPDKPTSYIILRTKSLILLPHSTGAKDIILPLIMTYDKNGELTFDRFDPLPDRIEELETVLAQEIKTRPRKNK